MRSIPGVPASTFSITPVPELDSIGINVADDDVLLNLVTKDTQLMSGTSPWRGGREKDPILLQMLIESTTQFGDIVLDCTASTGKDFLLKILINLFSFFFHSFFLTPSWIKYRSFCPRLSKGWSPFCGLGGGSDDIQGYSRASHSALFP